MICLMADYWPKFFQPRADQRGVCFSYNRKDGTGGPPWSATYENHGDNCMTLKEVVSGKLDSTWYLRLENDMSIMEYRDDYPQTGWQASVFGKTKVVGLSTPIGWGRLAEIGTIYSNRPVVNPLASWPPSLPKTGFQAVSFESYHDSMTLEYGGIFREVIQILYQQTWDNKTTGARMWFAKDVGPIANQWVAVDQKTGLTVTIPRQDATVTWL